MREMWMMAPVLFPVVSDGIPQIWNPGKNKIRTAAAALSLAEAVCSWLAILNCMGVELLLQSIKLGMKLYLRMDGTGALFSDLASLTWVLVAFFAFEYMEHRRGDVRFPGCLIISLGALTGVVQAGNFVTLCLSFEMMTFLNIPLVFHLRMKGALCAGMVYLAYSMLGTSIALGGYFSFRQYTCGADFKAGGVLTEAARTAQGRPQILLLAAFCMTAGSSYKASLMPLHPQLPIAHLVASVLTGVALSGLTTKAGMAAAIHIVYDMASPAFPRETRVQYALLSMAVVTIFIGSMLAHKKKRLKRRLVYSPFSRVPCALLGVSLLSMEGFYGSLLRVMFHALAKNALFLCAGAMICRTGCTRVERLKGMGKWTPAVMVRSVLASLSLVGIPPAGGFLAKQHLAVGAMRADAGVFTWLGSVVLMVSALLTAGHLSPVVVEGSFPEKDWREMSQSEDGGLPVSASMGVPLAVLGIPPPVLGALGNPVSELLRSIALGMVWKG